MWPEQSEWGVTRLVEGLGTTDHVESCTVCLFGVGFDPAGDKKSLEGFEQKRDNK